MKKEITFCEFCDGFRDYDRDNNFSYEGKKALYEYLEQYEEDTGCEVEFDVIALCCEYTEYENLAELQQNYTDIKDIDDLKDHTAVIEIEDSEGFIIQDY